MILILALIQLIVFVFLIYKLYKIENDYFFPAIILIIKQIICESIYAILLYNDNSIMDLSISNYLSVPLNTAVCKALIIDTMAYIVLYCGIRFSKPKSYDVNKDQYNYVTSKKWRMNALIVILIGILSEILFFNKVGGFTYYFNNLYNRQVVSAGSNYINFTLIISIGVAAYVVSVISNWKRRVGLIPIVISGISLFAIVLYGGRNPILYLLVMVFGTINFLYKKISFKDFNKLKVILLTVVVVFLFILLPSLRDSDSIETINNKGFSSAFEVLSNTSIQTLTTANTLDRATFIYDYYTLDKWWLGKSYLEVIPSLIPRNIYKNKPAMDEGLYINSILSTHIDYHPFMPSDNFPVKSSFPVGISMGYINFGILGMIISMFLQGKLLSYLYYTAKKSRSFMWILIYLIFNLSFNFSNLGITSCIFNSVFIIFISVIFLNKRYMQIKE
ncbi:O-antigen polymerase [Clostridium fungisolvens]|uniref:Oligosaccharide repeat unit polymerase n=1 Tax=Clostridium fungisolvens TaxID=1604897 RepID=A0A6V8SBJ3_9CLOT|nr:O-antigen polymerase [Clostridium fungisolvens]GFP74221.1 hypothetical protein bsdtw1_00266 [Clostridium fungisolvens]